MICERQTRVIVLQLTLVRHSSSCRQRAARGLQRRARLPLSLTARKIKPKTTMPRRLPEREHCVLPHVRAAVHVRAFHPPSLSCVASGESAPGNRRGLYDLVCCSGKTLMIFRWSRLVLGDNTAVSRSQTSARLAAPRSDARAAGKHVFIAIKDFLWRSFGVKLAWNKVMMEFRCKGSERILMRAQGSQIKRRHFTWVLCVKQQHQTLTPENVYKRQTNSVWLSDITISLLILSLQVFAVDWCQCVPSDSICFNTFVFKVRLDLLSFQPQLASSRWNETTFLWGQRCYIQHIKDTQ